MPYSRSLLRRAGYQAMKKQNYFLLPQESLSSVVWWPSTWDAEAGRLL